MHVSLGVDVGGTAIKYGLVDEWGTVWESGMEPTRDRSYEAVLEQLNGLFHRAKTHCDQQHWKLRSLGLAVPGGVDVGRGVVTESPNFPDWKEVPLQGDLERSLGESIALGNDANCAGLGEWVVASRRSVRHFALLTLGTGVGGCLIVDGRLVLGKSGLAGELGHLPIQPDGPICGCGGRGCLEQYASHSGILRLAARHFPPHALPEDAKSLVQLAMTGDARALATWAEVGQKLGLAVAMLVNALNLEEVALGGGISPCFPFVKDALLEEVERRCFRRAFADLRVYQAQLGNQAGLVGAGLLPFAAENPSA